MQPVKIHQIAVGPMANFSYLIEDTSQKKAAYIDPGWEASKVVDYARSQGITIEVIWITHAHFDHIQDLKTAVDILKVPVRAPALELNAVERQGVVAEPIRGEETLGIGSLKVKALFSPGHTPGEMCLYIENHLITGDVLFVDGCGRVDLPGSDPEKMFNTLAMLAKLPDATIIYPGHDYGPKPTDTLGHQKKTNPYLNAALTGKDLFFERRGV